MCEAGLPSEVRSNQGMGRCSKRMSLTTDQAKPAEHSSSGQRANALWNKCTSLYLEQWEQDSQIDSRELPGPTGWSRKLDVGD